MALMWLGTCAGAYREWGDRPIVCLGGWRGAVSRFWVGVFVCFFPEEPWEREKRINLNIQLHKHCHKNHIHLQSKAQR